GPPRRGQLPPRTLECVRRAHAARGEETPQTAGSRNRFARRELAIEGIRHIRRDHRPLWSSQPDAASLSDVNLAVVGKEELGYFGMEGLKLQSHVLRIVFGV